MKRPGFRSRKNQRGATIVLLMIMVPLLLIPLVGLAIDATRLYIVQSKLSAAVDGAVLGSGRLLGTNADTSEIAGEFLNVNFPNGYWGTSGLQKNIQYTSTLGAQTISIYATVNLPLTFIRVMGIPQSLVSASAVATRRITRVEIVLDRSGSMDNPSGSPSSVFNIMKSGALWFAAQFTPGYDELGLVVFNGSGLVAYPTGRPYSTATNVGGGPDKTFATDVVHQVGPIFDQLNAMAVGGGTGTEEAMALAYIELQKAHNRDLAANGVDNTLNTIVLFTDGVPDAVPTYLNNPLNNSLKPKGSNGSTQTTCTNQTATATASTQMRGYLVAPGGPPGNGVSFPGWGTSLGLARLASLDTSQTLTWWLNSTGTSDLTPGAPTSSIAGCIALGSNGNKCGSSGDNCDLTDIAHIPTVDLYGYSTTGTAYTNSLMFNGTTTWSPNTGSYDPNTPATGYNISAASWNATDNVGKAIRAQTAMNQIQIFTIGYSGNSGTDLGLLKRLANTPDSSSFISTQPIGKFYLVNAANQLSAAFDAVASSLLRLAQ